MIASHFGFRESRMDKPTAQNARLQMWGAGGVRSLVLDFADGRQVSTMAYAATWESVIPIVLHDAPVDLKTLMSEPIGQESQAATSLPVCAETLSALRLLRLLEGVSLPTALRVTRGWMQVSLRDRADGKLDYQCTRVVNLQLLGLIERPSPVLATEMPQAFPEYLDAVRCIGLSAIHDPYWSAAQSFLGSTCLAFVAPRGSGFRAYLAISDCKVSYPTLEGGGLPDARKAVQTLISYLPAVVADEIALRLAGWEPSGHEILEIAEFLEELEKTLARATGR
jgi:hypothetical protein